MVDRLTRARETLAETLDGILGGEGDRQYVICNWNEDEAKLFELYKAAIPHLEAKLGPPNYSGKGHIYPTGSEGSDPGVFFDDYSRSIEISWWRAEHGVFAAMVSGHDADSLLCFTIAFRRISG
jgi:hypothetical protein